MIIYYLIYTIPFLLALSDFSVSKKQKKTILYTLIFIFTLFRGLRWENGTDWDQYLEVFQNTGLHNIFNYDRYGNGITFMEPGYMFLNTIISWFGNYSFFLLLTNFFILCNYYLFIKKTECKYPIIAFSMLLVSVDFFPVRQDLAIGIFLWAFYILSTPKNIKRRFLKYTLLCFLACLFHKSSIFLIPFYFLIRRDYKLSIIIPICILAASTSLTEYIFTAIDTYIASFLGLSMTSLSALEIKNDNIDFTISLSSRIYFFFWLIIFYRSKKYAIDQQFTYYLNGYIASFIIFQLFYNPFLIGFSRLTQFFYIFFPLCFAQLLELEMKNKKTIVLFIFILLYWYKFSKLDDAFPDLMYPYNFVLFN